MKKPLNKKTKRVIKVVINVLLLVITIVLYLFTNSFYIFGITLVQLLYFLPPFFNKKKKKEKQKYIPLKDFVDALSYFRICYKNNENVYNAIIKTSEYTKGDISIAFKTLGEEMLDDPSITPFINFMENFKESDVHQVILTMYQLIDYGGDSKRFDEFNGLYETLMESERQNAVQKKENSYNMVNNLPLVAIAILMFGLLSGIILIIGEQLYG
ncbi:MAG: hypothetical protein ACOX28_04230 [Bacilli bacterium]|jgi:hypothetical protein